MLLLSTCESHEINEYQMFFTYLVLPLTLDYLLVAFSVFLNTRLIVMIKINALIHAIYKWAYGHVVTVFYLLHQHICYYHLAFLQYFSILLRYFTRKFPIIIASSAGGFYHLDFHSLFEYYSEL